MIIFLLIISLLIRNVESCHNNCNRNGKCNKWDICECFQSWTGPDCSLKTCPSGPSIVGIASSTDTAHRLEVCSGRGHCDHNTGNCICASNFVGNDCGRSLCQNNCNNNGECVSLRTAAVQNDGFRFNRTTTYNQWDADIIYGCKCDPGFSGYDCSERVCEYGPDPRKPLQQNEKVTLVCDCSNGSCSGKAKLKYMGVSLNSWLYPTTTMSDLSNSLMNSPQLFGNNKLYTEVPIVSTSSSATVCAPNSVTRTEIEFKRTSGDLPALTFYANVIKNGNMYFETTQVLRCDCTLTGRCNGTFHISFDGEVSSRLFTYLNATEVQNALKEMKTIKAAGITVSKLTEVPICFPGIISSHNITLSAQSGNIPPINVWSSITANGKQDLDYYSTSINSTNILKIVSDDGIDSNMNLCNGVGNCDFTTGVCKCPFGYTFDPDHGPCGQESMNTSLFSGIGRCPGVVDYFRDITDEWINLQERDSYNNRMYISFDPSYTTSELRLPTDGTLSTIQYFPWVSVLPDIDESLGVLFLNLTTNSSAGPILIDAKFTRLFFVDANPVRPFIGRANLDSTDGSFDQWLFLPTDIFGFAMDARFRQRKLYWTEPGVIGTADGGLYWTYMDSEFPTIHSLTAAIGQANLLDPMGVTLHLLQDKIYWVDKNTAKTESVLRSCNLDGTNYNEVIVFTTIDGLSISTNLGDIAIDYSQNNTAVIMDAGNPSSIIAVNLDTPTYNSAAAAVDQYKFFYHSRVVTKNVDVSMVEPKYLIIDQNRDVVLWSDISLNEIKFAYYILMEDSIEFSVAYTNILPADPRPGAFVQVHPNKPVGMVIDLSIGAPKWGAYQDCYGNGRCKGPEGNFECDCYDGFFGDCQSKYCPKGPAWFHEPIIDEIAHDEYVECSNMGSCDRKTGSCICAPGFEGKACDRMTCPGMNDHDNTCNGAGRCLSMRDLATKKKNNLMESTPLIYGSKPYDPLTWDADMIYGCHSDHYGYFTDYHNITKKTGYELTKNVCPHGYNMRLGDKIVLENTVANYTYFQEAQNFKCFGTGGYFTLSFRGDVTPKIYAATANTYDLKLALQSLLTVGGISIELPPNVIPDRICSINGDNEIKITFKSELGDLPMILLHSNHMTNDNYVHPKVLITPLQDGIGELVECSGKGECDHNTGLCKCWNNWGSSDGYGRKGPNGDCGHNLIE